MHLLKDIVLASASPRRRALFAQMGIPVRVIPSDVREDLDGISPPGENAMRLALAKAQAVAPGVGDSIVVGADTIVVLEETALGKPAGFEEACRMLRVLSGRTHTVHTGFALVDARSGAFLTDVESTRVTFREIPEEEIREYVAGGSPLDKAGAYGIQDDYGAVFAVRVEGCFYTVVGFPLAKFYIRLREFQSQLAAREGHEHAE
ncbi:MAG: Maf family protein [Bacteroidota bacterium]